MIQFGICDDNKIDLTYIHELIQRFSNTYHDEFDYCVARFYDASSLLESVNAGHSFDILFLDVLLPGCDGIELAKKIRLRDESCMIIFLSASPEFAISSYEVGAFYYLLKPVEQDKFYVVMKKALEALHTRTENSLVIKTSSGIERIRYCDIAYIESMDHKQILHKKEGSTLVFYARISDIFKTLSCDSRFVMPHRSYIVNLNCASAISSKDLTLIGNLRVPVSKKNYPQIKRRYLDFLFMTSGEDCSCE